MSGLEVGLLLVVLIALAGIIRLLILYDRETRRRISAGRDAAAARREAEEAKSTAQPETEVEILQRLIREARSRLRQYRQALSPLATIDVTELTTRLTEARLRAELRRLLEEEEKLAKETQDKAKKLEAEETGKQTQT